VSSPVNTFHLKYRDTRPIMRVRLRNPDGSAHDLTGALAVTLHIKLAGTSTVISRTMTMDNATQGIVSYAWLLTDWAPTGDPLPAALALGVHDMEYEVTANNNARGTFPNATHDRLSIIGDLGQMVTT